VCLCMSVTVSLTLLCTVVLLCEINEGLILCLPVSFQYLQTLSLDI
jgi:hypothetical protein